MNYPELLQFVPTRLAVSRVLTQSATVEASETGSSSLNTSVASDAPGSATSIAYEDIALIQKSIGRMMSETDESDLSTNDERQDTMENLVPTLYTHDQNPWFHLRKNPQPLPSIGPYTANLVCWFSPSHLRITKTCA